ncbi:MAG: carbohydrate kinase, partial [Phenylobacterium sp.]
VLGPLRPSWVERTGLSPQTQVVCGLHDSNAALLAARGCAEIAGQEATVLSTGTWFVGMRTPGLGAAVDIGALPEGRDCLVNVDAYGRPIPSARFMGGREAELLGGSEAQRIDIGPDQPRLVAAAAEAVRAGARVLPTLTPGAGPFPNGRGRWVSPPADPDQRRAATGLYLAMTAHAALGLIGARERIVVEGRFAGAEVFVRALAALRPSEAIYVSGAEHDASYGALRLLEDQPLSPSSLTRVRPLEVDIGGYAQQWAQDAGQIEAAA